MFGRLASDSQAALTVVVVSGVAATAESRQVVAAMAEGLHYVEAHDRE